MGQIPTCWISLDRLHSCMLKRMGFKIWWNCCQLQEGQPCPTDSPLWRPELLQTKTVGFVQLLIRYNFVQFSTLTLVSLALWSVKRALPPQEKERAERQPWVYQIVENCTVSANQPSISPSNQSPRLIPYLGRNLLRRNYTPSCSWNNEADCQKNVVC